MKQETFWQQLIEKRDDPSHVVVAGQHYTISPEKPNTPRHRRGTNGDRYDIRFFDGRTVTSTNLWHQGPIPAEFREQLPDNAEFVKEQR